MTTKTLGLSLLVLSLLPACDSAEPEEMGVGPGQFSPQGSADDEAEPADDGQTEDACFDATREYSDALETCYDEVDPIPDAYVEAGCEPEGDWHPCVEEIEAFTACGEEVGCASWHGALCWDGYRAMTVCLGQPDPGAEPPACEWPGDGECDEPEGTGLCLDGTDTADCGGTGGGGTEPGGEEPGPSCDPEACSGCVTECDEWGCYSCCWACSGDACEESCNF